MLASPRRFLGHLFARSAAVRGGKASRSISALLLGCSGRALVVFCLVGSRPPPHRATSSLAARVAASSRRCSMVCVQTRAAALSAVLTLLLFYSTARTSRLAIGHQRGESGRRRK